MSAALVGYPLSAIPIVPESVIAAHHELPVITVIQDGSYTLLPTLPKPDFDKEVLIPLRTAQAKIEAARVAAERACTDQGGTIENSKCVLPVIEAPSTAPDESLLRLRECESGDNYAINAGNGYYGAYQYDLPTWANYGGYSRPDLAPPSVQDAKVKETQSQRGWSPWPACSAKLGLSSGGS